MTLDVFVHLLRISVDIMLPALNTVYVLSQTLCQALILMRNRGLVTPTLLLELFFELFRCQDTLLRKTLRNYIVQDIKKINVKHRNAKVNRVSYVSYLPSTSCHFISGTACWT